MFSAIIADEQIIQYYTKKPSKKLQVQGLEMHCLLNIVMNIKADLFGSNVIEKLMSGFWRGRG